jgi:hypothetical protein
MLAIPRCIFLHNNVPYSGVLNYCNFGVKYVVFIVSVCSASMGVPLVKHEFRNHAVEIYARG